MRVRHHFPKLPAPASDISRLSWRLLAPPTGRDSSAAVRTSALTLFLIATLGACATLIIMAAERHNTRDMLLHGGAIALILGAVLLSLLSGWVLLRTSRLASTAREIEVSLRERLLEEKAAAEAANIAKSRYLANISHEIRSPLNSIYGYAQLVERGDSISAAEAARIIARSAEHLTSLVDGLLDMSQVEHGVLRVSHDIVRFPAFLEQIAGMFRQTARAKGLDFQFEAPELLPEYVRMDQKRLRQVLINLLSNAIKFTDYGEVRLKVEYSGQIARFYVIDTGPGIAPEDQQRIFTPFERGSGDAAKPGVGLGLPITRALVQILGGDLDFESTVGVGTTFRVTMLLGLFAGKMQETAPMERVTGYEGPRRSILVVDDDLQQLAFVSRVLESKGFDVPVAGSGEMALTLCANTHVDLALLDISMPGMTGWETAAALRRVFGNSIRIVMLSANADEADAHASEGPHDLFLVKPIEIDTLLESIGDQLELRWEKEAIAPPEAGRAEDAMAPLPEVAHHHLRRIRDLVRIGHVRGIEAEIKLLASAAPEAEQLVARLFDCLDRFDLSTMAAQLERTLGTEHA